MATTELTRERAHATEGLAAGAHTGDSRFLAHHFDSPQQQFDSGKLGMWLFLVTEVLFFGGLFCAYAVYRSLHPEVFAAASRLLDQQLGAINTAILIFSSMTMAWAVRCAQLGQRRGLIILFEHHAGLRCGISRDQGDRVSAQVARRIAVGRRCRDCSRLNRRDKPASQPPECSSASTSP